MIAARSCLSLLDGAVAIKAAKTSLASSAFTVPRRPCGRDTVSLLADTSSTAPHSLPPSVRFCSSQCNTVCTGSVGCCSISSVPVVYKTSWQRLTPLKLADAIGRWGLRIQNTVVHGTPAWLPG